MDNKDSQQDSQSHTRHVCDAAYTAMLVTQAPSLEGKLIWLIRRSRRV